MTRYDNPLLKKEGYVHVRRAAEAIRKHPSTIYRLVKSAVVPSQKDGAGWYVHLEALAKHLASDKRAGVVLAEEIRRLRDDVIAEGCKQCSSSSET